MKRAMKFIVDLKDIESKGLGKLVGGKASNLGVLIQAGIPVPGGIVLTTTAFDDCIESAGLRGHIKSLFETEHRLSSKLAVLSQDLKERVRGVSLPIQVRTEILQEFERLIQQFPHGLIVRSSATIEDVKGGSFAGLLSSYPNIKSKKRLVDAIRNCWASIFSPEAVIYVQERSIDVEDLAIAVIIQEMVDAEKSGLVFSRDPTGRDPNKVVVEAIFGFGEDIVSGEITPERYLYSKKLKMITMRKRGRQEEYLLPSGRRKKISSRFKSEPKLAEKEVNHLATLGIKIEELFSTPQDIEWAFGNGEFRILQARPLLLGEKEEKLFPQIAEHVVLLRGIGVSPRVGSGRVVVEKEDEPYPLVGDSTVVVVRRITNDLAVQLRQSAAVVADEGGATSHGANILREFHTPCVLSTKNATKILRDGDVVTVDGYRGVIYEGDLSISAEEIRNVPETGTKVFVSVLVPEMAKSVAAYADGVSSMRNDYFVLESGVHPAKMIADGNADILENTIYRGLLRVARMFKDKPVWYKTMDAPTDEFVRLEGGEQEQDERNPLLGWRGIGRELEEPEMAKLEFRAVKRVVEEGFENIGIKLPFVRVIEEFRQAKEIAEFVGLKPHEDVSFGISVETPSVVFNLQKFINEGVDFISVGLSDLVMCILALDRESQRVANKFNSHDPAVIKALKDIARVAKRNKVFTCVCGESARDHKILQVLIRLGYDAVGVSMPYFSQIKNEIRQLEDRLQENPRQSGGGSRARARGNDVV